MKLAIEYQGLQHFESVEYFGGEDSLKDTRERDQLKLQLSTANGVDLIYFYYYQDLSIELVKEKLSKYILAK